MAGQPALDVSLGFAKDVWSVAVLLSKCTILMCRAVEERLLGAARRVRESKETVFYRLH